MTELASARRLARAYGRDTWHTDTHGWLVWDGKRWKPDRKAAQRLAHNVGELVRQELAELNVRDPNVADAYYKHARALERAKGIDSLLQIAQSLEGLDGTAIAWDAQPWLLNVPNGTLDLKRGVLREHCRDDHITRLCAAPYDDSATAPRFMQFLAEVFRGDEDLIDYWQWAAGYALSGSTDHDCFFVLHGAGANGKTTMLNTLMATLGDDYAQQLDPEELMQQKHTRHSTERAQLRGARLVAVTETSEGRRLNEALVKSLTGGDKVRARYMRKDSFEFTPELKLFLGTNHRPVIRDNSNGMWRRIRLIPFEAAFEGPDCDPKLQDKLRAEAPGILAWAVAGARRAARAEPDLPKAVQHATDDYRADQDAISKFLEEECVEHSHVKVGKAALYEAYKNWSNGRCESNRDFNRKLKERGYDEGRMHGGRTCWIGIALHANDLAEDGEAR